MKSGHLALVGGEPPLACFHISSCGLMSSASIMRTGLGATHVSDAPTRSARAVCPGHLFLRMPEYQPRDAFRSLASVLNWPTQSSTGVTRGVRGFRAISGQHGCLQAAAGHASCPVDPMRAPGRSRAAAAQTQGLNLHWLPRAVWLPNPKLRALSGSTALIVHVSLERRVDHVEHAPPARQRARWPLAGKRCSAARVTAAAMRPLGRPRGGTPYSGSVHSPGRRTGSHCASETRLLVLRRTIAVSGDNGVPRAEAHHCTSTRNPTSPSPHWCFRALFDACGSPSRLAILAALVAAARDSAPQWPLRLSVGAGKLERSAHQRDWCSTTLFNANRERAEAH